MMIRTLVIVSLLTTGSACAPTNPTPSPPLPIAQSSAQCHVVDGRADRHCTPGALNPDVTQSTIHSTICVRGWTATVRPPAAYTDKLKRQQMAQYGETGPPSEFEEDHKIALSAGGAPTDPLNLWPEPRDGSNSAAAKDADENSIHRAICAGTLTLQQGQQQLNDRWTH